MKYYKKNGTLFVTKSGGIPPYTITVLTINYKL